MKKHFSSRAVRRLAADEGGNVAMITALAMIPLSLASLGAVDLTRSFAGRVELQDALDAAALAAGRGNSTDAAELERIGKRILAQNLSAGTELTVTGSSFAFGPDGRIVASAQATFHPLLGGLGGSGEVAASTEVKRANSILEIALVLDNTASMKTNDKIDNLRKAATKFVQVMQTAADQSIEPKSVQIALVPFSNTVRVGASYREAAWMDQTGASPINDEIFTTSEGAAQKGKRWDYFAATDPWRGCVEMRQAPYDVQDTPPDINTPATLFTPMFAPDEADTDKDSANNYLIDPSGKSGNWWAAQGDIQKYKKDNLRKDKNNQKVTLSEALGPNKGCDMQPIQLLTTDFSSITSAIDQMKAVGETNIPNGLFWGWMALSPKAPFSMGVPYLTPKHRKIVVLMTDGDNTMLDSAGNNQSTYSAAGFVWQGRLLFKKNDKSPETKLTDRDSSQTTRTTALNYRMKQICANMKKSDVGIEIYTVGVGVSESAKALLKECASGEDHYFDVKGTDMTAAFQSVANQISQLHLAL